MKNNFIHIICLSCIFFASACEKTPVNKFDSVSANADCSRFDAIAAALKIPTDGRNKKLLVMISDGRFNVPGADQIDRRILSKLIKENRFNVVLQMNTEQDRAITLPCYPQIDKISDAMKHINAINYGHPVGGLR